MYSNTSYFKPIELFQQYKLNKVAQIIALTSFLGDSPPILTDKDSAPSNFKHYQRKNKHYNARTKTDHFLEIFSILEKPAELVHRPDFSSSLIFETSDNSGNTSYLGTTYCRCICRRVGDSTAT